jgi:hypothetical protein
MATGDVIISEQEDDFEPVEMTLAEFVAIASGYPEADADNARAAALEVGESFQINDGPQAPIWTITRVR